MDRFQFGIPDLQEQPLLGVCKHCGCYLYTDALHITGKVYCDEYCYEKDIEEVERYGNA